MHIAQHARVLLAVSGLLIVAPSGRTEHAADIVITGHVRSDSGAPLYGANVTVVAAQLSVGTDEKGFYRLEVPAKHRGSTLVVRARMFGFVPVVRSLTLDRDSIVADFALKQDVNSLSQVVVTGVAGSGLYETKKLPFTVATVTAQDMAGQGYATPDPVAGESYARIKENGFRSPRTDPLSTFGVDVDRASYSNVRRIITEHQ
jgi:Ca-activated chloride channel homolog